MDEKIKVTDKRMFTADGELRQELEESEASDGIAVEPSEPKGGANAADREENRPPEAETGNRPESGHTTQPAGKPPGGSGPELPAPSFLDLVGLLAQPVAMFLGDAELPDGTTEQNLPLARYHIDLLELLEKKTEGNISPQEAKLVEDLLYQLRMRYVEKAG